MAEENGVPKRLRIVEVEIGAMKEFNRHVVDFMKRNDRAHEHLNEHLDNIDRALVRVSWKVAMIVGAASAGVTIITWILNHKG